MPAIPQEEMSLAPPLAYARLLRESQKLIDAGMGDSPEAAILADRMDGPWSAMTAQEQDRLGGLSEDLYSIAEGGPIRRPMSADELITWRRKLREVYTLAEAGEVGPALAFFRQPVPDVVPGQAIRFLQARCWEKLGDMETALVFMREAERLDPSNAVSVLTLLTEMNRHTEAAEQAERLVSRPDVSPAELYLAGGAFLALTQNIGDQEAAPDLQRAHRAFTRASSLLADPKWSHGHIPDLGVGVACGIGLCLERLGDRKTAIGIYNRALALYPSHPDLLTMRGLAVFFTDPRAALPDFVQATRAGTNSIWPWYILARHALVEGAYGASLRLALRASERPGPSLVLAEVYETIGISQAMLGQLPVWVLENLSRAAQFAPNHPRIQRTLELAQALMQSGRPTREWRADLTVVRLDPRTVSRERQQAFASRLLRAGEAQESRVSTHLLAS